MLESKKQAYNKFELLPKIPYKIVSKLVTDTSEKANLIWKLLKYDTPDAWKQDDLSLEEKRGMVFNGNGDINEYSVFLDPLDDDVTTREKSMLRIWLGNNYPENRTLAVQEIVVEIFVHSKLTTLSNYENRYETMMQCIFEVLNGTDVGGVGLMYYDNTTRANSRMQITGSKPFKGKTAIFGVHV